MNGLENVGRYEGDLSGVEVLRVGGCHGLGRFVGWKV